jgi:hypothetical protein
MRRFIVPPSIALVAMGVLCLVSRNFVPLIRGRDVRKDAKRPHDSLSEFGSFQRPMNPTTPIRTMHCATAHHFPVLWCEGDIGVGIARVKRGAEPFSLWQVRDFAG